jgi:NAD(P)H dehydrogenase (quinone)
LTRVDASIVVVTRIRNDGVKSCAQTSGLRKVRVNYVNDIQLRLCSRREDAVAEFREQGKQAVKLDLDDPSTFALALAGVHRAFLLTGYTVAMLTQSKTFVDAAKKAGVKHIVHLGIFGEWDTTDPHFV